MSTEKRHLSFSSLEELMQIAKLDLKNKKPHDIYKRLDDVYSRSENARKSGDEEYQYIFLKRWLTCVEWLKNSSEYRSNKVPTIKNINQINDVKKVLEELKSKLDTKYKLKKKRLAKGDKEEEMDIDDEVRTDCEMSPVDDPINFPETPTRDPLVSDNEEIISCDQLFKLIHDSGNRYLIIDIRPKLEYEASRIKCKRILNIPNDKIKQGVLASKFYDYLRKDKESLDLYHQRGAQHIDVLILLDWNTSSKILTPDNCLNILRKIFQEWDPGVKYSRIAILDGGYAEWNFRYPSLTTNPKVVESSSTSVENEILDTIEYPEWVHMEEEETSRKSRENKSNDLRSSNKNRLESIINVMNNKILRNDFDFELSNNIPATSNSLNSNINLTNLRQFNDNVLKHRRTINIIEKNEVPAKPIVDRSNKPVSLDVSVSESKMILRLMKELHSVGKNKEKLEKEILEQERTLMEHDVDYKDSKEGEYIRNNLQTLCFKLEEKEKEYKKLEDELNNYILKMDSIKFSSAEDNEKGVLRLKLASLQRRMKNISADRLKLREKPMKSNYKEISLNEIENESNIHREPLKTDKNTLKSGNLERSHSSPNLLQLKDRSAPQVDRSSKPQVSPNNQSGIHSDNKLSHLSWANREERMTPVHGSVHPGITGLKNLGNSCYMNSIIQCLSNTTHLAKYFMDNLYADDLNTNNDSNTQGQVVEEVAQVIKALWRGQYKSISPHDLKIAVGQYKLQFESYDQQDSHEFLTFLLDWMHNDLKRKCKASLNMTVAEKAWDKAMGSQRSIISDLFFGQLRSTITCSFCKQSSTTYETFNSLTTSLPDSNRCTLNDCIQKFVSGQKVVGWKCPKCQTPREATKKFDFVKLAPIIVIHLSRFAESGGWIEKRNTAVDFPLTDFNLKPYLVSDSSNATISNIRSYSYSLYAMSNHYGTMGGGHYTAFCKNATQNKWYKYDDQTVTEVAVSHVKSQNTSAYLLFYTSFSNII